MRLLTALVSCLSLCVACDPAADHDSDDDGGGAGSAGGGGGNQQGGGDAASCGDGVVAESEECDSGGESPSCDDDCTLVSCGDGSLNQTAGEACDDGNGADGDACNAGCAVTPFTFHPSVSSNQSLARPSIAAIGTRFALAWAEEEQAFHAVYASSGALALAKTTVATGQVGGPQLAANADGGMLFVYDDAKMLYRSLGADGALLSGGELPSGYWPTGVGASPSGAFCAVGSAGGVRCIDGSGVGPEHNVSSQPLSLHGAALTPVGDRMVASYIADGPNPNQDYEFRVSVLAADGALVGGDLPLAGLFAGRASGGIARPDGSFAVVVHPQGGAMSWFPFSAEGAFDSDGVVTLHDGGIHGSVVAHASGRFVALWVDSQDTFDPNQMTVVTSCSLWGRSFDESAQPLAEPVLLHDAAAGDCVARYGAALNERGDLMAAWARYEDGPTATATYHFDAVIFPELLALP